MSEVEEDGREDRREDGRTDHLIDRFVWREGRRRCGCLRIGFVRRQVRCP